MFQLKIASGQNVANYSFANLSNGSLVLDKDLNAVDMTSGITLVYGPLTNSFYTAVLQNLGFTFYFMGTPYTSFSLNPDGQLRLGAGLISGETQSATANTPLIIPLNCNNLVSANGEVHYKVQGNSPNAVLIIEWKDMYIPYLGTGTTKSTFQLRLYENSGTIEFVYGTMYNVYNFVLGIGVGFSSGNTAGTVGQVLNLNTTPAYNTSLTNYSQTNFNSNALLTNLNSSADGNRTVFQFNPLPANAPSNFIVSNVQLESMTLNWTDNSSNELGFKIYQSADGLNYTQVATVGPNVISSVRSGLTPGTNYFWKVVSYAEGGLSAPLSGNMFTQACTISGIKNIPGDYATLTSAVADVVTNGISGSVIFELQPSYVSTGETFPITLGHVSCASAGSSITIRPASGAANLSITSTINSNTIDINGGNYWIIDGQPGGTGGTSALSISNMGGGTVSSAIRFINNGSFNIIKYVDFKGTNPLFGNGIIVFGTTTTTGNSNNVIDHCNVNGNAVAASPSSGVSLNGIYSSGSSSQPNINNVISNCNIYDSYVTQGSNTSSGILLSTGNSDWTIDGNSFYFSTTKTGTIGTATVIPINISSLSGNNFLIKNNFIGGSAPQCGGILILTGQTLFKGMNLLVGTLAASSIQGNTIKAISINSTISPPFEGITTTNGNYNIGNVSGNTIGNSFGTGSISLTTASTVTATAESKGININPSVNGITNISNNIIGSITVSGSSISVSHGFIAINNKSTTTTISNNIIGSNSSFSINANTFSVSGTVQQLIGILVNSTTATITNNIINHLSNSWTPASTNAPVVRGIALTGTGTVSGNVIHDLYAGASSTSLSNLASVIGMQFLGPAGGSLTISGNTIFALQNTHATAATAVVGLSYNNSSATGIISGNYIHGLTATSTTANITGIDIGTGSSAYRNNFIGLGYDTLGNSLVKPCTITGIWERGQSNKVYHNTVYIGGSGVTSSSTSTYAFNSSTTTNARDFRNNIFINARSNATTGGKHYAVQVGGTTPNPAGLTLDYNIYQALGTGGVFGRFNSADVADLNAWRTAVGKDVFSKSVSPCLANPTGGFPNLHLTNCGGAGSPADMSGISIPSVTDDIDGDIRASFTPTDIGADAGNFNPTSFLGAYPNTSVTAGGNATVIPVSFPINIGALSVLHPPSFSGIITVDPITGIVYVTDAKPAGTYLLTVKTNNYLLQTFTLTVTNPSCSRANFKSDTTLSIGADPVFVAVGDFNRDGNQDFVTAYDSISLITVSLGDGQGGIAVSSYIYGISNPSSIAVADFNGDGKQDLAITSHLLNYVYIFLGDGSGLFNVLSTVAVGTGPSFVIAGDFNNDGIKDLAVANEVSNTVSIRLGSGNGFFTGLTEVSVQAQPRSVAVGDFNGDNNQDIAVACYSGFASIRLGNGLGGFSGSTNLSITGVASSICAGDFNGDGFQDIAVAGYYSISVSHGNGTGAFTTSYSPSIQGYFYGSSIAAGDFNGNGAQDVVVAFSNANKVLSLFGSATGILNVFTEVGSGTNPSSIAVGDFNNDGIQDVVTAYKNDSTVKISTGKSYGINVYGNNNLISKGSLTPSTTNFSDMGFVPISFGASKTLSIKNNGSSTSTISSITLTGSNAGDFSISGVTFPLSIASDSTVNFTLNCNTSISGLRTATVHVNYSECTTGDYDFAVQGTGGIPVLYPYPSASVTAGGNITVTPTNPAFGIQSLRAIASGSFMGTIASDPVTGKIRITNAKPAGTYTITVYPGTTSNQTFVLTVVNPLCTYGSFSKSEINSIFSSPTAMAVGDFNKDGNQDILLNHSFSGVEIYFGNGTSGFNFGTYNNNSLKISSAVVFGDFNSDGNPDVASSIPNSNEVLLNFADGSGGLGVNNVFISISVGTNPSALATGDFNGDGKLDIACSNHNSNNVSIRLGNGSGGFTNAADVTVGTGPNSIAVGDFNSDGKQDIMTANDGSSNVSVRLGNGSGGFTGTTTISLFANPSFISLGDFNADGKQDFAAVCNSNNLIFVRYGDGLGNFTGITELSGGYNIKSIAVGDYNGDGKPDIATASQGTYSVVVFTNNGLGGFYAGVSDSTAYRPAYVVMGDFNNDSIQDLATVNPNVYKISVLTGNKNTINVTGNGISISDGNVSISSVDNTDFGLAPLNNSLTKYFTILNKGASPIIIGSITKTGVNAGDFSVSGLTFPFTIQGGDSVAMPIACTPTTNGIKDAVIHINTTGCQAGDYDFAIQANAVTPTLGNYSALTVFAGGNGMATPSAAPTNAPFLYVNSVPAFKGILIADPVAGVVRIVDARPAGTYTITVRAGSVTKTFVLTVANPLCSQAAFNSYSSQMNYINGNNFAIADFNKDGNQDLISSDSISNWISRYDGDGVGSFNVYEIFYLSYPSSSLAVGDINGDGISDVVFANPTVNKASFIFGDAVTGFTLVPGGGLTAYNPSVSVGTKPVYIALADFNGDGKLDLATANYTANTVSVRLGDGSGHFSGSTEVSVGSGPNYIATGDFNADGKVDFATTNYLSNTVSIRLGNGTGGFTGTTNISVGAKPNSIAFADFNSDGKTDFATANYIDPNNANVSICIGNGTGGFTLTSTFAMAWPITPTSILSGDFNGDGKQDIAFSGGTFSPTVSIYLGNGNGTFGSINNISSLDGSPGCMTLGDVNNDGIQDIIVSTSYYVTVITGKVHGIKVSGNTVSISDGSTIPSLSDNTDFGMVPVLSQTARVFTISNDAISPMIINSITLTGTNQSNFTIAGITFPLTIVSGASKTFSVSVNPSGPGIKTATVHVNYTECTAGDYDFAISANSVTPSLGTYTAVSVNACGNITVTPTSAPVNVSALYVSAPSAFMGILEANPSTGVITITNARPAGTYTITARTGVLTRTFTLTVVAPPCSPGSFALQQSVSVDNNPKVIAVGDFNNDGNQDLLVLIYTAPTYANVRFGDGIGGFSGSSSFAISNPNQTVENIVVADFNGDGKDDIAFTGYYMTTVEIRLGDGLGWFTGSNNFSTGLNPSSLSTGDFNNDGKTDLVVSNQVSNTVSIWLGDGAASFYWNGDITATSPKNVGVADFNNDGNADLAIANTATTTVSIKLGNGLGSFSGSTTVTVGSDPISLVTGDFNNDGKQDFITGNQNNFSPNYSVRLGNGAGGFTGTANVALPGTPHTLVIGDFNGDNFADFASATNGYNKTIVRYGNGSGAFTGTTELSDGAFVYSFVIGDFNEDKVEDIITTNSSFDLNKQTSVFFGTSNEINLQGIGNNILDGSNTVSVLNNTNLGTVNSNTPFFAQYVIQNTGLLPLTVNSITFTGINPADFTVSSITFPKIISANSSTTFYVVFTPSAFGVRSAVVHVNNTDCNEGDYDFLVQGTYCNSPVFSVCPGNQNVNAASGFCRQTITYTATVTGGPTPTLTASFTGATIGNVSGTGSGSIFNTGITHVVITATNICGMATCAFDVTVTSSIDDNDVCTVDNCNSSTGVISHTAVNSNDNNACTTDGCNSISGVFNTPININDNNACTDDGCLSITGVYHNQVPTDDTNPCTDDGCNPLTGIFHNPVNLDDGSVCTDDNCTIQSGITHTPINVNDNNVYTLDGCDSITGVFHHPIFTLKVYLEGFYSGGGLMDNNGNGGCLRVTGISNTVTNADSLHLALIDAASFATLQKASAILQTNGTAVFVFDSAVALDCYLRVRHRNSLETWSSIAISPSITHSYDFTLSASQAYGNNMTEVFDHYGWAFYGGDVCDNSNQIGIQNGIVNGNDFNVMENAVYYTYLGYVTEDLTGDGIVESTDYVLVQNNSFYNLILMRP